MPLCLTKSLNCLMCDKGLVKVTMTFYYLLQPFGKTRWYRPEAQNPEMSTRGKVFAHATNLQMWLILLLFNKSKIWSGTEHICKMATKDRVINVVRIECSKMLSFNLRKILNKFCCPEKISPILFQFMQFQYQLKLTWTWSIFFHLYCNVGHILIIFSQSYYLYIMLLNGSMSV